MAKTFTTEAKSHIRNEWGKPILKFLSKRTGKKLLYLGLPSPAAEDLNAWIDLIDEVIAFQCREYGKPSDISQSRKEIEILEEKLNKYERQGLLNTFTVYDGYIEEVVLRGIDNISKEFTQTKTIKVYNLDFCNSITSPIEYIDKKGDIQTAYKFNAVKKLLRLQSELEQNQQEFVLFLTIHASFKGAELQNFINNPDTEEHKELIKKYNSLNGIDKNTRILKLFVIDTLQNYFRENNFIPHFLPTILYKGLKKTPLLHFTIIGLKENPGVGRTSWQQTIGELCNEKLIGFKNGLFELLNNEKLEETDTKTDAVALFSSSKTFEKFWKR